MVRSRCSSNCRPACRHELTLIPWPGWSGICCRTRLAITPRGGTVWVRAEQSRDSTLASVANTGPSIPAGDLAHVFGRFYRVENSRDTAQGGAGIGLALVKELVEAVGGQVGAESGGAITRFWFRLPA